MDTDQELDFSSDNSSIYVPRESEVLLGTDNESLNGYVSNSSALSSFRSETGEEEEISMEVGRRKCLSSDLWKRNTAKRLRNSGRAYENYKGEKVAEKTFKKDYDCQCLRKCRTKLSDYERKAFFDSFWQLADFSKQNIFLKGLIKREKIKRYRKRGGTGRVKSQSFLYFLRCNDQDIQVCKKYFLETLQISWGRVYRCLRKADVSAVTDGRGRNPAVNKIDDSDVIEHIKCFPTYQSHYTRMENPNRRYLDPNLSIKKMYDLYVQKCAEENKTAVKEKFYYKIFKTKFNLHFKLPHKDTCKVCDELTIKIQANPTEEGNLKIQKEDHLKKAELARQCLKDELFSSEKYVGSFDFQKALPFPKLTTSVAYYKRNMYVSNFGVNSKNLGRSFMYMWDETEGGRGAQEVAACLIKHLTEYAQAHKHIVLYCDACGGQNRNIKLSLALLKLVTMEDKNFETIDLKFMTSGHSFLPNDADFSLIENSGKKHELIYEMDDWYKIAKSAKRRPSPFEVIKMDRSDFLSTKVLEDAVTNRKTTVNGIKFSWLNIQWLRFERSNPLGFKFKESLRPEMEFSTVSLHKNRVGKKLQGLGNLKQSLLYPERRRVTIAKRNDMISLLRFIPPIYHTFFKNLPVEINTRGSGPYNNNDENNEIRYD